MAPFFFPSSSFWAGGTLDREKIEPALIRFGALLGLPSPGHRRPRRRRTAMVDRLFTSLMAEDLGKEIDKASFVNVSRNFLTGWWHLTWKSARWWCTSPDGAVLQGERASLSSTLLDSNVVYCTVVYCSVL